MSHYLLLPALLLRELARADFGARPSAAWSSRCSRRSRSWACWRCSCGWRQRRAGLHGDFQGVIGSTPTSGLAAALPLYGAAGGTFNGTLALAVMVPS